MHFKCRLPIDGWGLCKAREAYGESLRFLFVKGCAESNIRKAILHNLKQIKMMKKSIFWSLMALLMVTMMGFGITSCGDDDKEEGEDNITNSSSIVGMWKQFYEIESSWVLENGKWKKLGDDGGRAKDGPVIYFAADGIRYGMELDSDGNWQKSGERETYSVEGNNLIFEKSSSERFWTFSISGDVLEIVETDGYDGISKGEEIRKYRRI